jgi:hypothetical protein
LILTKPIAGQDYGPGFIGFCKTHAGGIMQDFSDAISWMECQEESDNFEKALGESTPDAPSHVFICIGNDQIIHAYTGGVQKSPLSMFLANPKIQVVFREPVDMSADDARLIIAGAASILGNPYNYPGLVGRGLIAGTPLHHWAWYMKLPLIINGVQKLFRMKQSYYCSAAASHALKFDNKYLHTPLFDRMDESKIMPSTLYAEGPFKPLRFDKDKTTIQQEGKPT